ncbi:MAG: HNH endonuclease [Microbacterium sp.]|nr:MAG: HNH endonuclease [Microbacterium sp.]
MDAVAAALAAKYAAAVAGVASAEAEVMAVLAEAQAVGLERVAEIPRSAGREAELPLRALAAELGACARQPDRSVQRRMNDAHTLVTRFAASFEALAAGVVSVGHVRAIVEHGVKLTDPKIRASFEVEALERAASTTPGRLGPQLARLVEQVQPTTFAERHKTAREGRGVWVQDVADGMTELLLRGPAVPVHGIHDMITHIARDVLNTAHTAQDTDAAQAADAGAAEAADAGADEESDAECEAPVDSRTLDQVRADVLMEMILTHRIDTETGEGLGDGHGGLASIRATVNVTVPALALAGLTDDPAELVGRAPIDLDTARILAASVPGWERVLADPITGGVLAVDRYTRSADLTRHLRVRDPHCRFPGCRMPTHRCDVDHGQDFALGGATDHRNLCALCRRHHTLKGETPWRVKHHPGGVIEWISPGGLHYIDTPPPVTIGFVPDLEDAPF